MEKKHNIANEEVCEAGEELFQISEPIIKAFNLLGANEYVVRFYTYLVSTGPCTLEEIPIPFNRKIKSLEFLRSKGWLREDRDVRGKIYVPKDPQLILDEIISDKQAEINVFGSAKQEFEFISKKDRVLALNTPDEFYNWQSKLCRNAKHSILAVTDRWKLAWLRCDDIREAVKERNIIVRVVGRVFNEETASRAQDLINAGAQIRDAEKVIIRFMVIDEESVFFAIRDPAQPEFHIGAWIKNAAFAENLVKEMNVQWDAAKEALEKVDQILKK
ncbi:MAG TPA: hypothetical protein VMV49_08415 [Candidatus Deferrimicrobium sp.]|nr:hypothetical protein [Candidatus Deferrimicrobium sp.]